MMPTASKVSETYGFWGKTQKRTRSWKTKAMYYMLCILIKTILVVDDN